MIDSLRFDDKVLRSRVEKLEKQAAKMDDVVEQSPESSEIKKSASEPPSEWSKMMDASIDQLFDQTSRFGDHIIVLKNFTTKVTELEIDLLDADAWVGKIEDSLEELEDRVEELEDKVDELEDKVKGQSIIIQV